MTGRDDSDAFSLKLVVVEPTIPNPWVSGNGAVTGPS